MTIVASTNLPRHYAETLAGDPPTLRRYSMRTLVTAVSLALVCLLGLSACAEGPTQPTEPRHEEVRAQGTSPSFYTFPWGLNQNETLLLAAHPWLKDCTARASMKAFQFRSEYASARRRTTEDGYRVNSYQHAIWNVLLAKECGWAFSTVAGAEWWAWAFSDAHERGTRNASPLREMDYHNNARGRDVFRQYAYTYFQHGLRKVGWQDDTFLKSVMAYRADRAVKFSNPAVLGRHPGSLVFVYGD